MPGSYIFCKGSTKRSTGFHWSFTQILSECYIIVEVKFLYHSSQCSKQGKLSLTSSLPLLHNSCMDSQNEHSSYSVYQCSYIKHAVCKVREHEQLPYTSIQVHVLNASDRLNGRDNEIFFVWSLCSLQSFSAKPETFIHGQIYGFKFLYCIKQKNPKVASSHTIPFSSFIITMEHQNVNVVRPIWLWVWQCKLV